MDLTTKDTLTIKEFAKTFDIKILHERFYLDKENNHETFNKAYSNMLRFKMFDYYDYSDFDEPKYTSFRNSFISSLFNSLTSMPFFILWSVETLTSSKAFFDSYK